MKKAEHRGKAGQDGRDKTDDGKDRAREIEGQRETAGQRTRRGTEETRTGSKREGEGRTHAEISSRDGFSSWKAFMGVFCYDGSTSWLI